VAASRCQAAVLRLLSAPNSHTAEGRSPGRRHPPFRRRLLLVRAPLLLRHVPPAAGHLLGHRLRLLPAVPRHLRPRHRACAGCQGGGGLGGWAARPRVAPSSNGGSAR
jgi:hypothetical protein